MGDRKARRICISDHFLIIHTGVDHCTWTRCVQFTHVYNREGSGGPAGTVLAGPLFEFLTVLLAINYSKSGNFRV